MTQQNEVEQSETNFQQPTLEIADIRQWTFRRLTLERREEVREIVQQIKDRVREMLGERFALHLPRTEGYLSIEKPHGDGGYQDSELIIDIDDKDPREPDAKKIASYVFFPDMVINRPNHWLGVLKQEPGRDPQIEILKPDKNERENYEVGKEELVGLLVIILGK